MNKFVPALRILLGALFLWSGFLKLIEPWQNFQVVIEAYRMIEGDPVRLAARVIPWIESIGGLFLVFGLYTRAAAAALWVLNTLFVSALAQALVRKLPIRDCGCFGDSFSLPLPVMLGVDAALWFGFGSLILWDAQASKFSLDAKYSQPQRRKR